MFSVDDMERPNYFKIGGIIFLLVAGIVIASVLSYTLGYRDAKEEFSVKIKPSNQYLSCIADYQESLDKLYNSITNDNKKGGFNQRLDILDRKYDMCQKFKDDITILSNKED